MNKWNLRRSLEEHSLPSAGPGSMWVSNTGWRRVRCFSLRSLVSGRSQELHLRGCGTSVAAWRRETFLVSGLLIYNGYDYNIVVLQRVLLYIVYKRFIWFGYADVLPYHGLRIFAETLRSRMRQVKNYNTLGVEDEKDTMDTGWIFPASFLWNDKLI